MGGRDGTQPGVAEGTPGAEVKEEKGGTAEDENKGHPNPTLVQPLDPVRKQKEEQKERKKTRKERSKKEKEENADAGEEKNQGAEQKQRTSQEGNGKRND